MKTRSRRDKLNIRRIALLMIAVLIMSCFVLVSCGKETKPAEDAEPVQVEETLAMEETAVEEATAEPEQTETAEPAESAAEESTADTAAKKEEKKDDKKDSSKKKEKSKSSSSEKQKKWVDPVYKTVNHPEEGHFETVTEWYCLCGEYVGSKEGWKKHREDFIASNGGVCNGEHVRPDPKETQVWVVDKAAWTEQVLVSEGHWE